jgi:GTP pyrophosphokinase
MVLTSRFDDALVYARQLHDAQVRKGSGTPYIGHLLAVAALVLEQGGSEDEAIAALLHDAVEDQGGAATREEIRRRYGDPVVAIVDGCTDADREPKPPWRQRKEEHLAHLTTASPSVRLVVTADKLHNARSILTDYRRHGEAIWDRFRGGRDGTLWYYRAMADALRAAGPPPLIDELDRTVTELEQLAGAGSEDAAAPKSTPQLPILGESQRPSHFSS